MSNEHSHIEF